MFSKKFAISQTFFAKNKKKLQAPPCHDTPSRATAPASPAARRLASRPPPGQPTLRGLPRFWPTHARATRGQRYFPDPAKFPRRQPPTTERLAGTWVTLLRDHAKSGESSMSLGAVEQAFGVYDSARRLLEFARRRKHCYPFVSFPPPPFRLNIGSS